jgi:hypothetical protein
MTTPTQRPRSVTAAFWLWLVSAVLLVSYGLFVVTVTLVGPTAFLRASGGILIVTGVGLGYLAGKSRTGEWRYARAAVALSLGLVVFLSILLAIQMLGFLVAPVVLFLIVAAGLVMRTTTANQWFAAQDTGGSTGV